MHVFGLNWNQIPRKKLTNSTQKWPHQQESHRSSGVREKYKRMRWELQPGCEMRNVSVKISGWMLNSEKKNPKHIFQVIVTGWCKMKRIQTDKNHLILSMISSQSTSQEFIKPWILCAIWWSFCRKIETAVLVFKRDLQGVGAHNGGCQGHFEEKVFSRDTKLHKAHIPRIFQVRTNAPFSGIFGETFGKSTRQHNDLYESSHGFTGNQYLSKQT